MLPGRTFTVACRAGAALAAWASLAAGAEVVKDFELGPRYIDPVNGFSLRPPARAQRNRQFSLSRLVQWSVRDPKTSAIAWTVTVRKEPGPEGGTDPAGHVRKMADALAKAPDVRLEAFSPLQLAGRKAFYLRTQHGRKTRRWRGEIWIAAAADRFLVLQVDGPGGAGDELESALREIASTLRLTDPASLAEARKRQLAEGAALLKSITAGRLAGAVSKQPKWYLYRRDGRDIGFLHETEGFSGAVLTVRTFARIELKGGQVLLLRRRLSATPDRTSEDWSESVRVRAGGKTLRNMSEAGTKRGPAIRCRVTAGGKSSTRNKPLPAATDAHYLPRAMALLLGRLVDRRKPAAWSFATYTTAANDFDMRTFAIVGPEKITLGARTVPAVRATDQVAADAEPAVLFLDEAGAVLRMRTDTGIVMEQSTRTAVLRRFPDAERLIAGR